METLVPIGELKTHCYQILDKAIQRDDRLIITKRGKAIAAIIPIKENPPKKLIFGAMQSMAKINGDIVSALDAGS
jgi:prevent-host-death family protein